jgi:CRISPR-associated endonuclease/helicase Cas3
MAEIIKCPNTATLMGLLHDLGKGNKQFKNYLTWSVAHSGENLPPNIPHPHHAAAGAVYAYQRWYKGEDEYQKKTAQLIAMCICGHHTGLANCLDKNGESEFLNSLDNERYGKEKENYKESVQYFLVNIAGEKKLDELFAKACEEIKNLNVKSPMHMGLLVRFFLSILVDADRWNSACFEIRCLSGSWIPSPRVEFNFGRPVKRMAARSRESISKLNRIFKSLRMALFM